MLHSILVPLDGSAFGEHALSLAASLARQAGATIHLVHVHQTAPPETIAGIVVMDSFDLHLRQDEQAYLADAARRLSAASPLPLIPALIDGVVAAGLRQYSEQHGIDLVVMCTHGRGALGRFWLGGVADELVRNMSRPVLLVHPGEGKPDLQRRHELKSILLPLDGTRLAEQVIQPVLVLGKLFGTAFTLVRVNKPVIRASYLAEGSGILGMEAALEQIDRLQRQAHDESQSYLDGIAAKLTAEGFHVKPRVVIDEDPAIGILTAAEACHADLIAMETHGRHGLSRLLLGSVADKIVRGARAPVLLNRPAQ